MLKYKPPKELRALFIIHYAPLLLIIMIGPLTAYFNVWEIPINKIYTIVSGLLIFIFGTIVYFKWEIFWYKTYQGQLVTNGIGFLRPYSPIERDRSLGRYDTEDSLQEKLEYMQKRSS